jgi:hypothetical protein
VTFTVQELPGDTVPVQVLPLPDWKSRLAAPWVSTFVVPKVVVAATL